MAGLRRAVRRGRALERRPRPAASARPRRALAAAALLALPLLAALAPAAQAQDTLVTNTGQASNRGDGYELATFFTTGTNAAGYTLSTVDIALGTASGRSTVVTIRAGGSSPGAIVATLANPSSFTNNSLNTFTAPANTTLAASTTYFLVVNDGRRTSTSSNVIVTRTEGNAQTGAAGWSIADQASFRNISNSWNLSSLPLRFAVKGFANPAAPTGLTATPGPGSGQVTLRWTNPGDNRVTSWQYDSWRGTPGAWGGWRNFSPGAGPGATGGRISGLADGTQYGFRVRARAGMLRGAASDAATATPAANPPPLKPTGLTATPDDGRVALIWDDPRDSRITTYQVRTRESGGSWEAWYSVVSGGGAASATSAFVSGLTNGTAYDIQLRARVGLLNGAASDIVSATPTAPPAKPTGLAAEAGDRLVRLSWDDPSNSAITKYQYRRGTGDPVAWGAWTDFSSSGARTKAKILFGLANGTEYSFQIRAVAGTLLGAASDTVSATPTAPAAQFASSAGSTPENISASIPISINPAPSAGLTVAYTVTGTATRGSDGDFTAAASDSVAVTAGEAGAYIDIDIIQDALREPDETVILTLADGAGYDLGGRTTFTLTIEDDDPPLAPAGFAAAAGDGQVVLSWTDPSDAAISGWQFRQRTPPGSGSWGSWTAIASSTAATTSHTVTGLTNGTAYGFQVRAVDGTLEGAASSEATATPTAATLPAKPAGLTAAAGDAQVVLSWTDPSNSSISEYEYQQRAGGGSWGGWTDFTSGAGTTTHTVAGLANGTDYDFRIRAVNSSGAGPASDAASATPLDANAPARFTVSAAQVGNQVTLTWSASGGSITGFQFRQGTGPSSAIVWGAWTNIGNVRRRNVTGLSFATTYHYQVRAVAGTVLGAASAAATITTAPGRPTGLAAAAGDGEVALSWTAPSGALTAHEYRYRAAGGSWGAWTAISDSAAISAHTVTGLTNGTEYEFQVRARSGSADSQAGSQSNTATATPMAAATAGVTTVATDTTATEGGTTATATFTVALNTVPSSNVTVTVTAPAGLTLDGPDAGSTFGSSEALTFTNSNWGTAQTVTVRATDDSTDSPIGRELTITYSTSSTDSNYNSLSGNAATITVVDNDPTTVTLAGAAGNVAEGATKDFTITLGRGLVNGEALPVPLTFGTGSGSATRGTDYTTACPTTLPTGVTCNDLNTAATPTVTFTGPSTGTTATQVTLTLSATTDSTAEPGGETVAIGLGTLNASSGTGLGGGASGADNLADFRITDNATPDLVLDPASLTVAEGGSATYTVALATQPTGNVTVTVSGASGEVTFDTDSDAGGNQNTLTFNTSNWGTAQTVTVSAGEDNDTTNDEVTLTHSAAGGGYGSVTGSVAVTVTDNDAPAAARPAKPTSLTATAGDAQVTLDWDSSSNSKITKWQYQLLESTRWRDIPASNAMTRRHTVTGLSNGLTYNIRVRAVAGAVNGQPSAPVSVRPLFGVAVLSPTSLTVAEGGDATYTVRLSAQPRGGPNTHVLVGISSSNGDVTVSPAAGLDFTTGNWQTPQTVTVSAKHDPDAVHDRATLSHSVQGGGYTLGSGPDLNLVVNDDESATPPPTVQTNAAPTVATPIPDQNARVGAPFSHTFPAGTFNDADGDPLTYSATGLPAWLGFNPGTRTFAGTPTAVGAPAVTVTASDGNGGSASDTFAIAISAANAAPVLTIRGGSAVTEGAAASFTVTADSAPTSNLTVSRTVADAPGADFLAAGVEGSGTWTFPGGRTSQTFTIATEADSVAEPSGPIRVTLGAGTGYTLGGASTATVTVNDNDAAPATCAPTAADLISTVRGYYASNRNRADRNLGENWRRVLIAFGAERHATLTPYTAAEARASERVWSGWRPVRVELERLEACPGRQPPAPPPNTPRVTVTASTAGPVTEGGTLAFTLTARPAPAADLTVNYTVADAANADFVAADGEGAKTAVIRAGESSADITVPTVVDSADEPSGPVSVTVDSGDGYAPGDPAAAEVRVTDNDATTVTLAGPADAIAEADGTKAFTVTLGRRLEAGERVRVPLIFGGAATRAADWTAACAEAPGIYCGPLHTYVSPHVEFIGANGAPAVATVTLTAVPDSLNEGAGETVTVAIGTVETNADGGASASGSLSFTIAADDDPLPAVTVEAGPGVAEGTAAAFTLRVSPVPVSALSVRYAVSDADGSDFLASGDEGAKTLTIGADEWPKTVSVPTVQDTTDETNGDVTLRLAAGAGYRLGSSSSAGVRVADDDATTLPGLSISDGGGGEGEPMLFTIRLSPASDETVRVRMDVRNATPPSARWQSYDYTYVYYDVEFKPGQTEQRRWVYIYDDAHDEGEETFEVVLSRAEGAVIADAVGVGTITNDDPLPAAYLARFGRTVAEQALDGIAGRMAAPRTPGVQGTLAGRALTFAPTSGTDDAADPPGDGLGLDGPQEQLPTLSAEEALLGSRFTLTGPADATGGTTAFWGRASRSTFDGTERGDGTATTLDGTVTTALLGADYARGDWLFGLALTQSTADGTYATPGEDRSCADPEGGHCAVRAGDGDLEAQLTAAVPYAALDATPHLKLWGAAGRGAGEVTLKTLDRRDRADSEWTMAAAGLRGTVLTPPPEGAGPALALTADALWTRTASDRTRDLLASRSDVTRLRLGVEGRYRFGFDGDSQLTPRLEAGVRHDGGDAETGLGLELGGGLAWSAPTLGLTLDVSGRTLIAHDDADLDDRGLAAALTFDPRPESARGPSLTLRQDVGDRAEGGLDALFAPDPLADRTASDATARWTLEGAWGFSALGGRFTASPHATLGLAPNTRETTLGWRLAPAAPAAPDLTVGVKATRREDDLEAPAHTVGVEATVRW